MKTYNHAFDLAFSVAGSTHPEGEDVTAEQFEAALIKRMKELTENNEWGEAVGAPFDSFEEDVPTQAVAGNQGGSCLLTEAIDRIEYLTSLLVDATGDEYAPDQDDQDLIARIKAHLDEEPGLFRKRGWRYC